MPTTELLCVPSNVVMGLGLGLGSLFNYLHTFIFFVPGLQLSSKPLFILLHINIGISMHPC